jgi:colicin import membrane protein
MNTVVYQEPYKLPAGILALVVHVAFFSLLYFGFSWQTQPRSPAAMSIELWQSLPEPAPAPPVKAIVETPPPVQVEEVVKPDIVIPEKKPKPEVKPVEKPPKKPEVKPEVKPKVKPEVKSRVKPEVTPGAKPGQSARPSAAEQQAARDRAEQEAATGRVVDEYTSKIATKIRRNTVMPPNVPNDARAEFSVTLLPGGTVLDARLTRSSGNAAYDNAVERAILKSQPLPLPPDAGMFSRFRELKLSFKPVE